MRLDGRLLDRIGLAAIILYVLAALTYYLPFLFRGAPTRLGTETFLLPPVWLGAVVSEVARHVRESDFAPRKLAAVALVFGVSCAVLSLAGAIALPKLLKMFLRGLRPATGGA